MHRGEIWWADIPGDKRRPVLVMTRERFIEHLGSVLVAPATTTVRSIPTELALSPADGMPTPCAINFDNIFTLNTDRLIERLAVLTASQMDEACFAYRFAAGC